MSIFCDYSHLLNSTDNFDPSLPLIKTRASGGTLAMWHKSLDPFVTPIVSPSSSILPLLLNRPGFLKSCHIGIYMPTSGLDDQFVDALSDLETILQTINVCQVGNYHTHLVKNIGVPEMIALKLQYHAAIGTEQKENN